VIVDRREIAKPFDVKDIGSAAQKSELAVDNCSPSGASPTRDESSRLPADKDLWGAMTRGTIGQALGIAAMAARQFCADRT
uniref:hypothetical protein n=1 Tax=Rhizobium giardinii TaxID=56731 RepID=UPI0004771552